MFCKPYRRPLSDAACSGQVLPGGLAAHLEACGACASAFAQEQALFAAINRSSHAAANAEVPFSLVPRVHAQIESIPAKKFWCLPAIRWATGGVAVMVIGFVYSSIRPSAIDSSRTKSLVYAPSKQSVTGAEPEGSSPYALPEGTERVRRGRTLVPAVSARSGLEVVVSLEEQAEFEKYIALIQARPLDKSVPAADRGDLGVGIKPLEIAELELGQLAIEPLEEGGSQ